MAGLPALPGQPVLVLQGGGSLGSYQAGVFSGLDQAGYCPQAVAGISIGAINGALIAGNPPERRRERLMTFWERITGSPTLSWLHSDGKAGDVAEGLRHQWAAAATAMMGAPGFFRPRWPWMPGWWPGQIALYETDALKDTLLELVDWDLLNSGTVRLAVGAVNVETGNFKYFCSTQQRLDVRHVMASGALPPGLPPVEIDGQYWWDGGLVSNTPLDHVLDHDDDEDLAIFQVDLFPARGARPTTLAEVEERAADIRFSSRTRFTTDAQARLNGPREAWARLAAKLPPELRDSAEARLLDRLARGRRALVAQLVYRDQPWQGAAKGREFSRATMQTHWRHGEADVAAMLARGGWAALPAGPGVWSFDATAQG
ncbi:patatin-like phospholipase family protein [Sandarakinorhabdus sp. AAP62]|uniref:patatin-like phospholipase family protein n=1 Tax=Sandarakinorhabdus sp. AAP62 TaxID=1248916 RepID=UPI00037D9E63|nr:patatin-like phospholipase family protein [Sandarakinorhabdus sp. AAP62]